jgi:hypothetical protein
MKRFFLAVALILGITSLTFGQVPKGKIEFKETVHNFGTIKEEKGSVTHKFVFKNKGKAPIVINHVQSSCGCTIPQWSKTPILPGKEGFIKATYDPAFRPGPFGKTITVMSTAETSRIVLRITGDVTPRPRTIEDDYPRLLGKIRMRTNYIPLYTLKSEQIKTDTIVYVNVSNGDVSVNFNHIPEHMTIKRVPEVVKKGKKGKLIFTYDPKKKNDWGAVRDNITFKFDGDRNTHMLIITANIKEDFSSLSAQEMKKAPKIVFENVVYDFGEKKQGEKIEHTFEFENKGKENLIIRKVRATCGCTAVTPKEKVIKPGQKSSLKAIFNTSGKRGNQNKSIYVTTNSPSNPVVTLRFKGKVNPKEQI